MNQLEQPITSIEGIKKLIPHREPMIMLDKLNYVDEDKCLTELKILKSNLFVKDELFQESGLVEHIAQSCAVQTGFLAKAANGKPKIGFIASVNSIKINELPKVGNTILTEVTTIFSSEGIRKISGKCSVGNRAIVEATMTLVLDK